jgi:hypothetical protein
MREPHSVLLQTRMKTTQELAILKAIHLPRLFNTAHSKDIPSAE